MILFHFQLTIFMNVIFYQEPELDGVTYPTSAKVISWLIAMFPMTVMLAWFLYEYCYNGGGYEVSLLLLFTPPPFKQSVGAFKGITLSVPLSC